MLIYIVVYRYESGRDREALTGWMLRRNPARVGRHRVSATRSEHIWCAPACVSALDHGRFLVSALGAMP